MPNRGSGSRRARDVRYGILGALAAALLLSGCDPYPFTPIKPAGDVARQYDNLYEIVTVIAIAVFAIVFGLIVIATFRFGRRRQRGDADPRQVFGNTPLELTWTFIPLVIAGLLFALSVQTLANTEVPAKLAPNALQVNIIGHQWYWQYQIPKYKIDYLQQSENALAVDGLHIPVDTPVVWNIMAADVQHGWWVPALSGKNEAIPGHVNRRQVVASKVGTYYAVCHYFCGIFHYSMLAKVVVQSQADFQAWVRKMQQASAPTPAPAPGTPVPGKTGTPAAAVSYKAQIQTLFTAKCAACHINQQLGGLYLRKYEDLLKGGAVVPGSIVDPKHHQNSVLWKIVQPNGPWPGGARMPLGGPYLGDAEIKTIADWIDQGAQNN